MTSPRKICAAAIFAVLSALPGSALPITASTPGRTSPLPTRPAALGTAAKPDDTPSVLASLKQDAAQHPDDYVTFETLVSARRFLLEHPDAHRETDRNMRLRGILGYWRGRTVALIPSLAIYANLLSSR